MTPDIATLARVDAEADAEVLPQAGADWTDIQARAPSAKAGTYVDIEPAPECSTYRFLAYKPDGARQMGKHGRWQIATEFGWKNAPLPKRGRWKPNVPVVRDTTP